MSRAALPWLLLSACLVSYSKFPEFHACTGQIGYGPSEAGPAAAAAPVGHAGKQLSAFIRKVEIFASGSVGLVYYWICLLIINVVFPVLIFIYFSKQYMPKI